MKKRKNRTDPMISFHRLFTTPPKGPQKALPNFRYDYDWLLAEAQRQRPSKRETNASGFASWIYRLTHPIHPSEVIHWSSEQNWSNERNLKLQLGKVGEREIEGLYLWLEKKFSHCIIRKHWILEFADPLDDSSPPFMASRLRIDDKPIWCLPDVVLRNKVSNEILIIERKVTSVDEERIPDQGWPNLMVQLWCYSFIDDWSNAPRIYLLGQIWKKSSLNVLPMRTNIYPRWINLDKQFNSNCRALFEAYGGSVKEAVLNQAL